MGNDSRRGLMTKSNKTVTIPYLPVGWSPPNPFCPKGAVRHVAHTFAARFMVRFQATKQQKALRAILAKRPHRSKPCSTTSHGPPINPSTGEIMKMNRSEEHTSEL